MIAWTVVACVAFAMAAVCALDRHQRRHRVRRQLRQIRTDMFRADVARMGDSDLAQAIAGICRATAAAERTNNAATKE